MKHALLGASVLMASSANAEPLIIDNGRLFIQARINGVATEALLDSGAESSLFDPKLAAEAHFGAGEKVMMKGSGGEQAVEIVSNVRIEALGRTIPAAEVVVMDMTDLSARLIKRPTRAIVGREVFDAGPIRIDLARSDVEALEAGSVPLGVKLPLTEHGGIEAVPVRIGKTEAQAVVDFGNGTGVMIGKELAEKMNLKVVGKMKGGGIGGEIERDVVRLPSLTLAGKTFRNVEASVDATSSRAELNIGTPILKHFVVTADFKGRSAWFAPVKGAGH
ncbi:retropepsin-like domain-containing protein [Sphingomonas sp. RB56-2]|uniref:Retropepsin-like domain-containing protein n=1 Tax=Sphingomonas brevis TaxID=2908206 RepID=A0ABT0S8B3_9SPHN|nr:retropepsin-like aspartic protease [Sphingomonas brevis]MCL6740643.1 retropepsin-like domain-containing protein [Sphingomonas brevis]